MKRQVLLVAVLCLFVGSSLVSAIPTNASTPTATRELSTEIVEMTPLAPVQTNPDFHMWLEQPYHVYVGESFDILIQIENLGPAVSFGLTLKINGTQNYSQSHSIGSGQNMTQPVHVTLAAAGYYEVTAEATDPTGEVIPAYCWIDVFKREIYHDLEVWLDQPYYVKVGEDFEVVANVHNAGTMNESFTMVLTINGTTNFTWTDFVDPGATFQKNITLHYSVWGYYVLGLTATTVDGTVYWADCFMWVEKPPEPKWRVWIEQDYYFSEDDVIPMTIHVENYEGISRTVMSTLWINSTQVFYEPGVSGFAHETNLTLLANSSDSWYNGYGYYDVYLEVWIDGVRYEAWCWFWVREYFFYVWLAQEYYYYPTDWVFFDIILEAETGMTTFTGTQLVYGDYYLNINGTEVYYTDNLTVNGLNHIEVLADYGYNNSWYNGPGYYDVYLYVWIDGVFYEAWCWFWIYGWEWLDVWIDQYYYLEWIGTSLFDPTMAIINPQIENKGFQNATVVSQEYWVSGSLKFTNSTVFDVIPGEFVMGDFFVGPYILGPGYYEIRYEITTASGMTYWAWCWFEVWEIWQAYEVYIDQFPYYIPLGTPYDYDVRFDYFGSTYDTVNLSLEINNEEVWNYTGWYVDPANLTTQWIPMQTNFTNPGYYNLTISLWSDTELRWYYGYCWVEVYEDWFIEARIYQDYWYWYSEEVWFDFGIQAYSWTGAPFHVGPLTVTAYANDTWLLFSDTNVWMDDFNDYWIAENVLWTPPLVGYYDIVLRIEWGGWYWEAYCWIYVEEVIWEIWIDQPYYWELGNPLPFELNFRTSSESFKDDVVLTLWVDQVTVWDEPTFTIDSFFDVFVEVDIPINSPGRHNITYYLVYRSSVYSAWCYIWIDPVPPRIDIWIEQPYYVAIDHEVEMTIEVDLWNDWLSDPTAWSDYLKAWGGQDYFNVTFWANDTLLFNDSTAYLPYYGTWSVPVNITFFQLGYYEIYLRIEMGTYLWESWCWLWVEEWYEYHELYVWIDQPYYLIVDETFDLMVVLEEFGSASSEVNYTLWVNDTRAAFASGFIINPGEHREIPATIGGGTAWPPGYYEVKLEVYSFTEGIWYDAWCYFYILREGEFVEDFSISIKGPSEALVDSFFDVSVEIDVKGTVPVELDLEASVFDPTGALIQQVNRSTTPIQPANVQIEIVALSLTSTGPITVQVEATSASGMAKTSNQISIDIVDELTPPSSEPPESSRDPPTATTSGFGILALVLAGAILLGLRRRR